MKLLALALLLLTPEPLTSGQKVCAPYPATGPESSARIPAAAQGFWKDRDDPRYALAVEGSRFTVAYDERVREVGVLLEVDGQEARICYSGRETTTFLRVQESELVFRDPFRKQTHHLMRLKERPPGLCLTSFHLSDPHPLPETQIREIQRELYERRRRDQAVLRPSRREGKETPQGLPWLQTQSVPQLDPSGLNADIELADRVMRNSEYVRELISEVGWIDVERFGHGASDAAFLLVQHSWDVPLMVAVLPQLKKDVDAGRMGADTYALLYDRLQLALGLPQRYGTQIGRDNYGGAVVFPVEDPAQVEELRRQLGLIPLTEYVRVFGASEVRFSPACRNL